MEPEALPPFLFSKKPIRLLHSLSTILQILANEDYRPPPEPKASLNTTNYDEQIRAPRMPAPAHYTYSFSPKETPSTEPKDEQPYTPATLDLSAPFGEPEDEDEDEEMQEPYPVRSNLDPSFDAERRQALGMDVRNFDGPVQLLYQMKKPLCTPAVLRPDSAAEKATKPLFNRTVVPAGRIVAPAEPSELETETPVRPTRAHWHPDSSADHCLSCFDMFGNFFALQRRRRHHCRFCGLLYCGRCIRELQPALGARMDAGARLVVPVWRNMPSQDALARFRPSKLCKGCHSNYTYFAGVVNGEEAGSAELEGLPKDAAFVFVENPYLAGTPQRSASVVPERRRLLAAVPQDWTWSSF